MRTTALKLPIADPGNTRLGCINLTEPLHVMKVLAVHSSPLMYTKIYLRPEPLGLELVAESLRRAGRPGK